MVTLCQSPDQAVASESRVEEILASNPDSVPALFVNAIIKAQQGNPMGAERDYENLLAAHPNFALAQKNLAILYAQNLVDPDKAYPVVLKAREAFPDDAQVAKALALVLFQKGDYTRTVSLFNSISDSGNADAEVFYCLGISQFHLKNYVDSKNSLQRALSLNLSGPQATDARETLAELKN
jgi:tetratricopeptide (TPR) repeat protein